MPGLSPDGSRSERIIAIINDGLKDNVSTLDSNLMANGRSCWRCQRSRAQDHLTLCEECRAYLSCETDYDPVPDNPPAPQIGYFGWAHAAWLATQNA